MLIRIIRPTAPTRYVGSDMRPRANQEDAPAFRDERSARRAAHRIASKMKEAGATIEVGSFVPEKLSSEQPWTPFEEAVRLDRGVIAEDLIGKPLKIMKNSRYTVFFFEPDCSPEWPPMVHMSIKRNDKGLIRDWRELQRIKNELVGPEHEAVELFPAESRLVDTANQYHLFVLTTPGQRFPFGWTTRLVSDGTALHAKQRPFESRPSDAKNDEQIGAMVGEAIKASKKT